MQIKDDVLEYMKRVDLIAEEIWQSENIRIHGRRRSVDWPEDVHEELVDSYKLTAVHLMDVLFADMFSKVDKPEERE